MHLPFISTQDRARANKSRARSRRRGQSFVETALVLSTLLMLVFMVSQVAVVLSTLNIINQISREGARLAAKNASQFGYCAATSTTSACNASGFSTNITNLMDSQVFADSDAPKLIEPIPVSQVAITFSEPGGLSQGQPVTCSVSYNMANRMFIPYSAAALKYMPGYSGLDKTFVFTTTMTME